MCTCTEDGLVLCDCCQAVCSKRSRRIIISIILGQLVSLCLCGTGISSQLLANKGVHTPITQLFFFYLALGLLFGSWLACKPGSQNLAFVTRSRGWRYAIIALVDVEANYLVVKAYQFTNLTSVQILSVFTLPVVLILSWLCLHIRYLLSHIIGVAICLVGVATCIYADILNDRTDPNTGVNRLLGDLLVLAGASCYAISNVSTEFFVKNFTKIEYLGMMGLFGSVVSGLQLALLERNELVNVSWTNGRLGLLLLFAGSMLVLYIMLSIVMQYTSATLYNLSIQTTNFYMLVLGIFMFNYHFHLLYFAGFSIIIIGTVVYALRATHSTVDSPSESNESNNRCDADFERELRPPSCVCCGGTGSNEDSFKMNGLPTRSRHNEQVIVDEQSPLNQTSY